MIPLPIFVLLYKFSLRLTVTLSQKNAADKAAPWKDSLYIGQPGNQPVHLCFRVSIVGLVQNSLLLTLRHYRKELHRRLILRQGHGEPNGPLLQNPYVSSLLRSRVQHVFDKNSISGSGVIHKHMGHGTDQFAISEDGETGHSEQVWPSYPAKKRQGQIAPAADLWITQ